MAYVLALLVLAFIHSWIEPFASRGQGSIAGEPSQAQSLAVTAMEVIKYVPRSLGLSNDRLVKVTFKNNSSIAYVLDGDKARAVYKTADDGALGERAVIAGRTHRIGMKEVTVGIVWVGTVGLYGDLVYDNLSKSKDPTVKYGKDELRRKLEGVRLGPRIILPGEDSQGTVFIRAGNGLPEHLVIPILVHPTMQPAGELVVDVSLAGKSI